MLLLLCLPPHLLSRALTGGSRWPRRFLGLVARACGARVRVVGEPIRPHSLILANHLSWMDILVLAGATGCTFVAKDELRTTPLIGWLADQNRTVYVKREERRAVRDQAAALRAALDRPQPLAVFPEGTVGDGRGVLPFRPSLLSAVAPPPRGVEVRPVAIDYGEAASEIAWGTGEPAMANVLRVLARRGRLDVTLHLLDPLPPCADRKRLADQARAAIARTLSVGGDVAYRAGG